MSWNNNKNNMNRQKSTDYSSPYIVSVGCVNEIASACY